MNPPETDAATSVLLHTPEGLVPRPHLLERLDEGRARPLTLVSGSARFGKTTLVSAQLGRIDSRSVWQRTPAGEVRLSQPGELQLFALQISTMTHAWIGYDGRLLGRVEVDMSMDRKRFLGVSVRPVRAGKGVKAGIRRRWMQCRTD